MADSFTNDTSRVYRRDIVLSQKTKAAQNVASFLLDFISIVILWVFFFFKTTLLGKLRRQSFCELTRLYSSITW